MELHSATFARKAGVAVKLSWMQSENLMLCDSCDCQCRTGCSAFPNGRQLRQKGCIVVYV